MYFFLEKLKNYIFFLSNSLGNVFLPILILWSIFFLSVVGFSFLYPSYALTIKISSLVLIFQSFLIFFFFVGLSEKKIYMHSTAILLLFVFVGAFYELKTSLFIIKKISLYWFCLYPLLISFFHFSIFLYSIYFLTYICILATLLFWYEVHASFGQIFFYQTEFMEMMLFQGFLYFSISACKFISAREKYFYSNQHMKLRERLKENKKRNFLLYHNAYFDFLTGLYNRIMAEKKLSSSIRYAKAKGVSISVFFIDVDGFKKINDMYGHEAGDECLKYAASHLKDVFDDFSFTSKSENFIARLAGDEFIIVLVNVGEEDMATFSRALLSISEFIFPLNTQRKESLSITFSIGGYLVKIDDGLKEKIFSRFNKNQLRVLFFSMADKNMYKAKKQKNSFYSTCFAPEDLCVLD